MKIKFLLLFIFLISAGLSAQTVKVIDEQTLQPISKAEISSEGRKTTVTDIKGTAELQGYTEGDVLKVNAAGYQMIYISYTTLSDLNNIITMSVKSYSTDEIIISADRFAERMIDVPSQVLILNSRDIRNLNTQTTGDLLERTGNVFLQKSQQEGGSPVLRGFEASRVLIVIDGVRMNNAIFRAGHLQNVLRIDQSILDRSEILFGPGSLMYGSDALGGVMAFYTKDPALSTNGKPFLFTNAYTRYATANQEKTGHIDFNYGLKNIAFLTSITYSDFGDLRMGANYDPSASLNWRRLYTIARTGGRDTLIPNENTNKQDPSRYSQYDIMEKIIFKQNENVSHTLNFQFSNTTDVPRYDRLNTFAAPTPSTPLAYTSAEWYYGPEKRLLGSYTLNLKNEKTFYDYANLVIAYQNIEESRHNRGWNKSNVTHRTEKVNVFSLNLDLQKKIKTNELRYGIEAAYNDVNSTAHNTNINTWAETPASTRYPDGGSNMKSLAGYLSHSWEINEKFVLSDGLRLSYTTLDATFNDTSFFKFPFKDASQKNASVTGHLGLVYMPANDWRFYLNASTGFRAPNVDDLSKIFETVKGTATSLGTVIVPNPDLKPEYTYTGEFGASKTFFNSIYIGGSVYGTYYKNAIITAPYKYNGQDTIMYDGYPALVAANQNADKGSYIFGTSLNFSADLTNYLSLTSTLNITYGRIITDSVNQPLDHIPPVFGKTSLQLKLEKFRGEFWIAYNGWKHFWDYNTQGEDNFVDATPDGMPSWYTLNLSAQYQLTNNLSISAALENILDKNYRVFASGINAPGRNFIVTMRAGL
ncbi:MAG TPA: TonB-dependent receptor [Ignavibacteria bacterium]|nr:TonB-dependent receptor [Ignavibacteria bacterium]